MKRIRLLGLALMAIFAFGVVAAATASAVEKEEAGLLFLAKEKGPVAIEGGGGKIELKTPAGAIICETSGTKADAEGEQEKTEHVTLIKIHITFAGCVFGKLKCNTEGDPTGQILILVDLHFVNVLKVAQLEPGIAIILLNVKHEEGTIVIKCGIGIIEVRGAAIGLLKVASLTADVTSGTVDFLGKRDECDTSDKLCVKIFEKGFEANFAGKFEPAEETGESSILFLNKLKGTELMVLVDD